MKLNAIDQYKFASFSGVIQLNCVNLNVTYVGLGSCLLMALVQDAVKAHSSLQQSVVEEEEEEEEEDMHT